MRAPCRSWYVCPKGSAVYFYITPDLVSTDPLKNWGCPNHAHCKDCPHAKVPEDKRKKKVCDFQYAFTDYIINYTISGERFSKLLNGCSEEARDILMDMVSDFAQEKYWSDWLKENSSQPEKKEATE